MKIHTAGSWTVVSDHITTWRYNPEEDDMNIKLKGKVTFVLKYRAVKTC